MSRGTYAVLDGMDGSGKGTQLVLLEKHLGTRALFTREPGGTPYAEQMRTIMLASSHAKRATPLTQFLLFWAAREELMERVVFPALCAGKHVISDRGYSSTWAYQIQGELNHSLKHLFEEMHRAVYCLQHRTRPSLHIFYDLPAKEARARAMRDLARVSNHYDERPLAYYQRVRDGFKDFARRPEERVYFVDATQTPEVMHAETLDILARHGVR